MAIDNKKLKQMEFAVGVFLKFNKDFCGLSTILAVADVAGEGFVIKDWFPLA